MPEYIHVERHVNYFAAKDPVEGGKFAVGRNFTVEVEEYPANEWVCKEIESMKMAEAIATFLENRRLLHQTPFDE